MKPESPPGRFESWTASNVVFEPLRVDSESDLKQTVPGAADLVIGLK